MKTNVIYAKVENKVITGCIQFFTERPISGKAWKIGQNFDETNDFKNCVELSKDLADKIHIGFSTIENGKFYENKEAFEKAMKEAKTND